MPNENQEVTAYETKEAMVEAEVTNEQVEAGVAETQAPAEPVFTLEGKFIPADEAAGYVALLRRVAQAISLAAAYTAGGDSGRAAEIMQKVMPALQAATVIEHRLFSKAATLEELNQRLSDIDALTDLEPLEEVSNG